MRRTYYDHDRLAYHELRCDGCGLVYRCHTDACYDWRILVDEATFAGWDLRRGQDGPHRCPDCRHGTWSARVQPPARQERAQPSAVR